MASQGYNEGIRRPPEGARPRAYKADALVLRAYRMREADRLVTVLTPNLGKLKLTVRGARRMTSKLGGHLDVLNHVRLSIAIGHSFDVVTGAESVETFAGIKADLDLLAESLYLMELTDLLLPEAAPHPVAYRVLTAALRALETGSTPASVARHTELALLDDAGYRPELRKCLVCGAGGGGGAPPLRAWAWRRRVRRVHRAGGRRAAAVRRRAEGVALLRGPAGGGSRECCAERGPPP